jgi:peptide deformylase
MILPITAYGTPVLRQMAENITADYPQLSTLIANMWDTMYHAKGVGLAAPQIGLSIRLFVVDTEQIKPDDDDDEPIDEAGIKKVFINAQLLDKTGKKYAYNEGCLSIPFVREDVTRPETITLQYLDENFNEHTETYSGFAARVIQHEYDHIDGILFTDHLSALKKQLVKRKLDKIAKGEVRTDYRMSFYNLKKR